MKPSRHTLLPQTSVLITIALLAGCANHPSNQHIQQQAAQTTEQVKESAEVAAKNARAAAASAEDKINAVAAGVRQGLQSDATGQVDLNTARPTTLASLPGVSPAAAKRIVAGRPYSAPGDLVTRKVLTPAQYQRIASRITVH